MPNRIIRPGINRSRRVNALGWPEEVFYRRLFAVADDYGVFELDFDLLVSDLYPLKRCRVSAADVEKWWRACVDAALVSQYEVQGGVYGVILNFQQHARTPSIHPQPPADSGLVLCKSSDKAKLPTVCYRLKSDELTGIQMNSNEFTGIQMNSNEVLDGVGDGDGIEGVLSPARGAGTHTHEENRWYPKTVDEVMAIAADPRCAVEISREQAEAYFLARDTADWIDAARRKIQPGKVYGDLRRWVMKDRQRDGGTAGAASSAEAEFEAMRRQNEAIRRNQ